MRTAKRDVIAVLQSWSAKERRAALAALLREEVEQQDEVMVPIKDDHKKTIGFLVKRLDAVDTTIDESTPYGREIRRRINTREVAIPVEELNAQLDQEERQQGRRP